MTAENKPPAGPTPLYCHLMRYMLVPARILGSWAPFAPTTHLVATRIKATVTACPIMLDTETRLTTFAALKPGWIICYRGAIPDKSCGFNGSSQHRLKI